jgi:hypothetical protein
MAMRPSDIWVRGEKRKRLMPGSKKTQGQFKTGLSCKVICVIVEIAVSFWLYRVAGTHRV